MKLLVGGKPQTIIPKTIFDFDYRIIILLCYLGKDETSGKTADATRIHDSPVACKAQKEKDFDYCTKQQVSEEIILPEKKADGSDSSSDSWTTVNSDGEEENVIAKVIATRRRENTPTNIGEDVQRKQPIPKVLVKKKSALELEGQSKFS